MPRRHQEEEKRGRRECTEERGDGLECSSPARTALHRLLEIVRKCRGGRRERAPLEQSHSHRSSKWRRRRRRRENAHALVEEDVHVRRDSPEIVSEDRRRIDNSECQRQEMTLNLALGVGLLSFVAASKTELDKAIELRKHMEAFLRSIQEENQSNFVNAMPSKGLSSASPYCIDDHALSFSFSQPESGISFVFDEDGEMLEKEGSLEQMEHLEEELAAELELLQIHLETENSFENRVTNETSSVDTRSHSVSESSAEVIDAQEDDDDDDERQCGGVPPLELERRLHELLQARQEERIKDLESHLQCLKKRLHEKEAELKWWKDTAKASLQASP